MADESIQGYIRAILEDYDGRVQISKDFENHWDELDPSNTSYDLFGHDEGEQGPFYGNAIKRGRVLKKSFADKADRNFLDSLVTVHYAYPNGARKWLEKLGKGGRSKDEISCRVYLPNEDLLSAPELSYKVGMVVSGHITLLSNNHDHLYSGSGEAYSKHYPERSDHSGANKGVFGPVHSVADYVLDMEDWQPVDSLGYRLNEALVDNWRVDGIVYGPAIKGAADFGWLVKTGLMRSAKK